jgi:hypothetical protein
MMMQGSRSAELGQLMTSLPELPFLVPNDPSQFEELCRLDDRLLGLDVSGVGPIPCFRHLHAHLVT